ncbi:hypothetical protein [Lactococcus allomyrinae]|uniref:Uncharacterized protein n=1 Tax=Lactococcus allomyrinae TaxID=2419773 RepID=A0A387BII0_9LACT|nr:hypothetical protein [Lactococcus allomyrinae]AYG01169.1 hypothetical protein D7I46_08705 [Lactococcus allomyrinae]
MTYISAIPNPKYKSVDVNKQFLTAFAATKHATVRLYNGHHGILKSHFFIEDLLLDGEVFQKVTEFEEIFPVIKTIAINGVLVAKRREMGQRLLTTGLAWREYYFYLPEKYR